jgi:hypothetical protein
MTMGELLKATLQEVSADENQTAIGDPVPVQFNPESLKLRLQNQTEGGRSRGRQRRQHNGASSTTLSMDLVFDTADEGTDEAPVSVRTKTAIVEKYVLPKEETSDAPPRLQFQWDQLIIAGIVESLDIDFDHFAENGAPLRAKVSLSIKEQEPRYTFVEGASGPAARDASRSRPAGGGNAAAAPGSGTNASDGRSDSGDRIATALEGETAPEFMARQGLDPSAWRGLGADLSAGLSLVAGAEIAFNAGLSAGLGVGASLGVHAEARVSLEASLGMGAGAGAASTQGASAPKRVDGDHAGLALSAAGGVRAALETLALRETSRTTGAARRAFGMESQPEPSGPATTRPPSTAGAAGQAVSAPGRSAPSREPAAPSPALSPKADPRATSYGQGVPLRALYPTALTQAEVRVCSATHPGAEAGPPFRQHKTTPPWEALPQRDRPRSLADDLEARRRGRGCARRQRPAH